MLLRTNNKKHAKAVNAGVVSPDFTIFAMHLAAALWPVKGN